MNKVKEFLKAETVLCIAFVLAVASMFITPPSGDYLGYIDYSVIGMLCCLMITVRGFSETGLFEFLSKKLTGRFKSSRALCAALALLCFFMAMLITNDVALLTFVPLTLALFGGRDKLLIRCIILETAAANLGSMATPIGNPQNLSIYSYYNYSLGNFFLTMLPISLLSLLIIMISLVFIPNEKISHGESIAKFSPTRNFFVYSVIFAVCVCSVARLLDYRICLLITLAAALIFDRKILLKIDYALLATFVCFFVFVGNISAVSAVKDFISGILNGRELLVSCALSQVISNVPCAIMLSGFIGAENSDALLIGVNIGGMGTLIASLASLISFKLYSRSDKAKKGRFFAEFTVYNFAVLAVLLFAVYITEYIMTRLG